MKKYLHSLRSALFFSVAMVVLCGFVYPLVLTGIAQVVFPVQANGSLIEVDGKAVGSRIVGQKFEGEQYFKGRPSSINYNTYSAKDKKDGTYGGVASGSYNYAPSNPDLKKRVKEDIANLLEANPTLKTSDIPMDLVTASGSGLDPDITVDAALVQIDAIAKASGLSKTELKAIVEKNTTKKVLGVLGEERVNVLMCNLDIAKKLGITK